MKQITSSFACIMAIIVMTSLLTGCAESPPQLPVRVASPIGRAGVCSYCDKKIEDVTADNLVVIDGIQYIVCDKKCAADLQQWLAKQ